MTAKNRPEQIGKLHTELKKHFKAAPPSPGRPLMEHVLYASLLEDTPADLADEGFAKCEQEFFDWNEVRVTTVTELAEVLSRLPSANAAAMRLKKNLQSIFETFYNFDIDYLKKENLGKAVAKFEAMPGISPFVLSYLVQHGLGGHAIPVDSCSMKIMMLSGIVSDTEASSGKVPGLERTIPKNRALEFSSLLHQAGIAFQANSKDKVVWDVLLAVNSDAQTLFDRPKPASKPAKKPIVPVAAATPSKATASGAGKASKSTPAAAPLGKPANPDKKSAKATGIAATKPVEPPKAAAKTKGTAHAATTKTASSTAAPASKVPASKVPAGKISTPEPNALAPKAATVKPLESNAPAPKAASAKPPVDKAPIAKDSSSKTPTGKSPTVKADKTEVIAASNKPLSAKAPAGKPLSTKPELTKDLPAMAAPTKAAPTNPTTKPAESKSVPAAKPIPISKPASEKKPASKALAEPAKNLPPMKPTAEKAALAKPVSTKPAAEKPKTEKPVAAKPTSKKTEEKPLSKSTPDAKLTTAKTGVTSTNKKLTKQKPR